MSAFTLNLRPLLTALIVYCSIGWPCLGAKSGVGSGLWSDQPMALKIQSIRSFLSMASSWSANHFPGSEIPQADWHKQALPFLLAPKERNHLQREESHSQRIKSEPLPAQAVYKELHFWVILILASLLLLSLLSNYRQKRLNKFLSNKHETIHAQQAVLEEQTKALQDNRDTIRELSLFKERLAHMAAHDMRNPLNTILALSEDPTASSKMAEIHEAGSHLLNFINNMLDIYKFEQARIHLEVQEVRPAELVLAGIRQVKKMRLQSGVEVETYLDRLLKGPLDPSLITRVVVNLLNNAIKYSPPGSTIIVRLYRSKRRQVCLEVEDQGPGLSPDQKAEVFQPLNQKSPQTIKGSASTGIGLNFCRYAVEAHGGKITVQSAPGGGALFQVMFPGKDFIKTMSAERSPDHHHRYDLLIAPEDKQIIAQVACQLKSTRVFEVSKIERALQRFSPETHRSLWPDQVRSAMYRGDQKAFEALIKNTSDGEAF